MPNLKVVCMYCKKIITEGDPKPISHGACEACAKKEIDKFEFEQAKQLLTQACTLISDILEYTECEHDIGICYCRDRLLEQQIYIFLDR